MIGIVGRRLPAVPANVRWGSDELCQTSSTFVVSCQFFSIFDNHFCGGVSHLTPIVVDPRWTPAWLDGFPRSLSEWPENIVGFWWTVAHIVLAMVGNAHGTSHTATVFATDTKLLTLLMLSHLIIHTSRNMSHLAASVYSIDVAIDLHIILSLPSRLSSSPSSATHFIAILALSNARKDHCLMHQVHCCDTLYKSLAE